MATLVDAKSGTRTPPGITLASLMVLALGTCGVAVPPAQSALATATERRCGSVDEYYRSATRLWTARDHQLTTRGRELSRLLDLAGSDGLDARKYRVTGDFEHGLSRSLVRYVHDLRASPAREEMFYVDAELRPTETCAALVLERAAAAPSITNFVQHFQEPNYAAARLKRALRASGPAGRQRFAQDLALARSLGSPERALIVDTTSSQLWMIDSAGVAASMKVAVGKARFGTPQMAGLMRFAVVNPYWHIPPDLVRDELAPRVAASGSAYLAARNYEVVSSYESSGVRLDPERVDWRAVSRGSVSVGIRQMPGAGNMLGRVMFMFPNRLGIYLHDTPARWVFARSDRRVSHGCVRLEHANELYAWLFGRPLDSDAAGGSRRVEELHRPVPVYILRFSPGTGERISNAGPFA